MTHLQAGSSRHNALQTQQFLPAEDIRMQEREHLARELHDALGGLLLGAKLDVACLRSRLDGSSEEVDSRLRHLAETLNSTMALKHQIIEGLHPSSLVEFGLSVSLEAMGREFSQSSGVEVATRLHSFPLAPSIQLVIYRLVQEALTNIGRHAQATRVVIRLRASEAGVEVTVLDDGRGFHVTRDVNEGRGLAGMRHRVEAVGGVLSVHSLPGKGTLISAIFPTFKAADDSGIAESESRNSSKPQVAGSSDRPRHAAPRPLVRPVV